jgi:hypothetical protein
MQGAAQSRSCGGAHVGMCGIIMCSAVPPTCACLPISLCAPTCCTCCTAACSAPSQGWVLGTLELKQFAHTLHTSGLSGPELSVMDDEDLQQLATLVGAGETDRIVAAVSNARKIGVVVEAHAFLNGS